MKKFLLGLLIVIVSVATALLIQNFPTVKGWFTKDATLGVGEYDLTGVLSEENRIATGENYYMCDLGFTTTTFVEGEQYLFEFINEDNEVILSSIGTVEGYDPNSETNLKENQFNIVINDPDTTYDAEIYFNYELDLNTCEVKDIEGSRILFIHDGGTMDFYDSIKTMKISVVEE